jgi:hypothetical protein
MGGVARTDFGSLFERATALAVQADGKLVATGATITRRGGPALALARYLGPSATTAETEGLPATCARFVADVTVPDSIPVGPGQRLLKTWRLENCGASDWAGYRLVRTEGDFGPEVIPISAGAPLTQVDVTSVMTAPTTAGRHRATYQMEGPRGRFWLSFWVEVIVVR